MLLFKKKYNKDQLSLTNPPGCAASRRTCCKQAMWSLSVINLRPS